MKRLIGRAARARVLESVSTLRTGRHVLAGGCLAMLCVLGANAIAQDKTVRSLTLKQGSMSGSRAAIGTSDGLSELLTVVEPKVEQDPTSVSALGDDFSPVNGTVTFSATDISIPGNFAIPVELRRWVPSDDSNTGGPAGWKWNIPYIRGNFLNPRGGTINPGDDWGHANTWRYGKNCSGTADSAVVSGVVYPVDSFWQGKLLHIPGVTSESFLVAGANYDQQVTKSNFKVVGCVENASMEGTVAQQGIIVQGPDGTTYTFAQVKTYFNNKATYKAPLVYTRLLLVTNIKDRFGNEVNYQYDTSGNLTGISASDGRAITIDYQNGVAYQASAHGRSWTYGALVTLADGRKQNSVTLPDGRQWTYTGLSALDFKPNGIGGYSQEYSNVSGQPTKIPGCGVPPDSENYHYVAITSPEGLQTSYTFRDTIHYRSEVEPELYDVVGGVLSRTLHCTVKRSLTRKTSSGAGVGPYTWDYIYSTNTGTYQEASIPRSMLTGPFALPVPVGGYPAPVSAGGADNYRSVTVAGPDKRTVFYIDRKFHSISEDRVVAQDTLNVGGTQLLERSESGFGLGALVGETTQYSNSVNANQLNHHINQTKEHRIRYVANVADASFTTEYPLADYDASGRPKTIKRFGSVGAPVRIERIVYEDKRLADDGAMQVWVLGLVKSISIDGVAQPAEQHTYHDATALRASTTKFGVLQANYEYATDGTLSRVIDGRNNATNYKYYRRGQPERIERADGSYETADINDWGLVTGRTDPNGHAWSYSYDAALRLDSITPPTGWTGTTVTYVQAASSAYGLPAGHWRQTVSKGNARTETYFDVLWRPRMVRTYDAGNEATTRKVVVKNFDVGGQVAFESYPQRDLAAVTVTSPGRRMQYDALGRITRLETDSETGVLATTTEYPSGFKTKVTNPRGKVTTQTLWAQDDPNKAQLAGITAPASVNVAITRNVLGNPTGIRRWGTGGGATVDVTRSYVYDSGQRLCKTLEPEVIATAQGYDAAGNVAWRAPGINIAGSSCVDEASVPANKKISYAYDTVNQLTTVTYGDGSPAITRTYWNDGALKTISSDGSVWNYDYNSLRKPTTESLAFSGKTYNFSWGYDADGNLSSLTYPTGGPVINYSPNALGEPSQVSGFASNIAFHPNGAVSGFTFGNNIVHSLTQTVEGTPKLNTDGTILQDLYTYDANGNVTGIADQRSSPSDGAFSRTMSYDDLDRLAGVTAAGVWGSASYVYDPVDNLRSASVGSRVNTLNYDASATRLTSVTSNGNTVGYAYDGNGNISQKGSQTFTFDLANRVAAASLGGSYAYDGHGRRTRLVRNDGSTHVQVYSQAGQLLWSEKGTAGTSPATATYSCSTGTLVGQQCVTTSTYPATTGLGCNAGDTLNGSTCTTTSSYPATTSYSCPSGGSLSGTTCTTSANYAASATYSCPSGGSLSGSTCYTSGSYAASASYSCPSGGSLSGSTCTRSENYAASVSYSCSSGDSLSGSTCTRTTYVPANVEFSCPSGGTLRNTSCETTNYSAATANYSCNGLISNGAGLCTGEGTLAYSEYEAYDYCSNRGDVLGLSLNSVTLVSGRRYDCTYQANIVYSCPSGGTLSGSQCISSGSYAATRTYSCTSGTLSGTQCAVPQTYAATASYSCPSGGSLSGSTCLKSTSYAASASYSCPSGGSLSGSTCYTSGSYTASASYSCPSGGTLSGSTCLKSSTYTATASYSCPSGGSLSGSSCITSSSYAATYKYTCNTGDTLNGSTCTKNTSVAATPGYSCPNGGTLSGTQCLGSTTISSMTAYVYLAGKQIAEKLIGGATKYVHTDALGSPVAHTDQAGTVLTRTKYEPYGYTAAGTKPGPATSGFTTTGSAIGFTGHVNDPETDLVYMQQRYYDPIAGRFLSVDPVVTDAGTGAGFNRYAYANNSPYKYVDPDGRLPLILVPLAIKAIDAAITAVEVYSAAQTGGASAVAAIAAESAITNAIPGGKIASSLAKHAPSLVKTYQTYTKYNHKTGETYSGRTSGTGTPLENIAKRDNDHHMSPEDGWGPAELDRSSDSSNAIRGREQILIDANGGAKSTGGTSGNAINGISMKNKKREQYLEEGAKL